MTSLSADIPLIDLSGPESDVAKQLVDAAAEHGFIYIKNQGLDIPVAGVDEAFALVRAHSHIYSKNIFY
jgi:isopenicillin N synthase-like dioxygenase